MENLPKDPAMLMSFLNMKLRDMYDSLEAMCDDMDIDKDELVALMATYGLEYSSEYNKFW